MLRWLGVGTLVAIFSIPLALVMSMSLPARIGESLFVTLAGDYVRLYAAEGTLGNGRGELWVRDFSRRDWVPWQRIAWQINLRTDRIRLHTNFGVADLAPGGLIVEQLRISMPPGLPLEGVSHPLSKAHWRGDLEFVAQRLSCPWRGAVRGLPACEGTLQVRWLGAASSILPIAEFGDYRVELSARKLSDPEWRADLYTERGVVDLSGYLKTDQRGVNYRFVVKGEKAMIGGLDNIAGAAFRKQGGGSEFVIEGGR